MNVQEIKAELERLEPIKQAIRNEAMVYQAGAKRECAAFNNVPATSYFYLAYEQWREVYSDAKERGWIGY